MFRLKRLLSVSIAAGALIMLAGCNSNTKKVTAVGSTALQPLVEQASEQYQKSGHHTMMNIQGGGSGTGLSQVQQKAVTIGDSDVFAEKQKGIKANELIDHKVAVVGMAPIVSKSNGVKNLTMKQLRDIFTGKIKNWKQVGGKNIPVTVIDRVKGSGTRNTFEQNVLDGKQPIKAQEQDSNGTVQKIVGSTPGAISYVSFFFINGSGAKPISIDGVKPTDKNVSKNKWKIWSYEHMYTTKHPDKETIKFIKYIESPAIQKQVVPKMGYISIHNMKVVKNADNVVTKK